MSQETSFIIQKNTLKGIADAIRKKKGIADKILVRDFANKIESIEAGGISGKPIEVDSIDNSLLTAENAGKVYKCDDKLYQVEKITSLKGLTIKFNEHITPCPVIGENDEFECSGIIMGDDFPASADCPFDKLPVLKIKGASQEPVPGTVVISFETYLLKELCYISIVPETEYEKSCWYGRDENANTWPAIAPAVIYKFNCPALNENPEFIKWVFANAKVYPNFENSNQIESFKIVQPFVVNHDVGGYIDCMRDSLCSAASEVNRGHLFLVDFNVDGEFIATFSIDGELVTKTFTNILVNEHYGDMFIFSNSEDNLVFIQSFFDPDDGKIHDENGNIIASPIKYNDTYVEGDVTFTKFDSILNAKTNHILSFILCYTTFGGECYNGFAFKEYLVDTEYDRDVEVQ